MTRSLHIPANKHLPQVPAAGTLRRKLALPEVSYSRNVEVSYSRMFTSTICRGIPWFSSADHDVVQWIESNALLKSTKLHRSVDLAAKV